MTYRPAAGYRPLSADRAAFGFERAPAEQYVLQAARLGDDDEDELAEEIKGGFLTVSEIGPNRSKTPEGFLICHDVPLARTGLQLYGPGETPVGLGIQGMVRIEREPEEVFAPEAIASLQGKPVVDEHPLDDDGEHMSVEPRNWRELACGVTINPRRGSGEQADLLVGDLIICEPHAIAAIEAGKRQISVGYDAEYETVSPGHGRQFKIRCNHVALVPEGRCGPRCAIGDAQLVGFEPHGEACDCAFCNDEETAMTTAAGTSQGAGAGQTRIPLRDRIRAAFWARDDKGLEKLLSSAARDAAEGEELPAGAEGGSDHPPENGGGNGGESGREHHVHVHLPGAGNGGNGNGEAAPAPAAAVEQRSGGEPDFTKIYQELDEMWDALNSLAGGGPMADAFPHRDARRGRDQAAADEFGEAPGNEAGKRLDDFELRAPPGTQLATGDNARLADEWQDTLTAAEILLPGVRLPVFDTKLPAKQSLDRLCAFRRRVLDAAYNVPDTREVIEAVSNSRFAGSARLNCQRVEDWFIAAAHLRATQNDAGQHQHVGVGDVRFAPREGGPMPIRTAADWQRANQEHYAKQRPQ